MDDFPKVLCGWSWEENKLFELALAVVDEEDPDRWEMVAAMVGGKKSAEDVQKHYVILLEDLQVIESGKLDHKLGEAQPCGQVDCTQPRCWTDEDNKYAILSYCISKALIFLPLLVYFRFVFACSSFLFVFHIFLNHFVFITVPISSIFNRKETPGLFWFQRESFPSCSFLWSVISRHISICTMESNCSFKYAFFSKKGKIILNKTYIRNFILYTKDH